jgi:type IV secretory pathway TraG/TraD family ATPase VirD4
VNCGVHTKDEGTTAAGGLIARAANRRRGKGNREAAGVLSAAQRRTHFLDSPRMTAVPFRCITEKKALVGQFE